MRNNKKQQWHDIVVEMDPNDQIQLADILVSELSLNENSLDEEDRYDFSASKKVRSILEGFVQKAQNSKDRQKRMDMLNRILNLSPEYQERVIRVVCKMITEIMKEEDIKRRNSQCEQTGHTFDEWKTYSEKKGGYDRDSGCDRYWDDVTWFRICNNCGYKETRKSEPQEVTQARKNVEKQGRIKQLRRELKNLEEK